MMDDPQHTVGQLAFGSNVDTEVDADFRGIVGSVVIGRLGLDDMDEPDDAALEQLELESIDRALDDLALVRDPDPVRDDLGTTNS